MSLALKDCTKAELMFIIKQFKFHCGSSGEYYLIRALNDVDIQRQKKRCDAADRLSDFSYRKRQEYIELLSPYEGVPLSDIPLSTLKAAEAAMKKAQAADRKWASLMMKGAE